MDKLVTFAGYDTRTGPHIFPIGEMMGGIDRSIKMIKMARPMPPSIEAYARSARPIPNMTQLLIDSMGSSDYYGSNVNGDNFPEEALAHDGDDYGFRTFMRYAYPFKHHVNKDPSRAYGEKVTLSDWDPHMHRVLLIVQVHNDKCQDILNDLAANRYWDVSMGCRVPFDYCSVCGNAAKTRADYCPHLRCQMNRILDDGRRVCAINRQPKFFDISFVTIGAEKASHVLKKVAFEGYGGRCVPEVLSSAHAAELYYGKMAAATKAAEITKQVPVTDVKATPITATDAKQVGEFMDNASRVKELEQPIQRECLNRLGDSGEGLGSVFSTLAALGINLRPEEFQRIVIVKMAGVAVADQMTKSAFVFDETRPSAAPPAWANQFRQFDSALVSEKIASIVRPYLRARSCYPEVLAARLDKFAWDLGDGSSSAMTYVPGAWLPQSEEEARKSSGASSMVAASTALAAGFMIFRNMFPQIMDKSPDLIKAMARHPWLLPLLLGAGVGAASGVGTLMAPRPLGDPVVVKTASASRSKLAVLGYIFAGSNQRAWTKEAKAQAIVNLIKKAGTMDGLEMYKVGSPARYIPGITSSVLLDSLIFRGIQELASRRELENADHR